MTIRITVTSERGEGATTTAQILATFLKECGNQVTVNNVDPSEYFPHAIFTEPRSIEVIDAGRDIP